MKGRIRLGTRGSSLALVQAQDVQARMMKAFPEVQVSLEVVRTSGDADSERAFSAIGSMGIFTKELDQALSDRRIEIAVHSLKDVPSVGHPDVLLGAVLAGEDRRDAVISRTKKRISTLEPGTVIGTASIRREAMIRAKRPDLVVKLLRGNLDTRLRKLEEGAYAAIVIAAAGLRRLGREDAVTEYLDPTDFVPAVGQGRLGITYRRGDELAEKVVASLNDVDLHTEYRAEKTFLAKLEGGCRVPLGCFSRTEGGQLHLWGYLASADGKTEIRVEVEGDVSRSEELGNRLADEVLANGGGEILLALRSGAERE